VRCDRGTGSRVVRPEYKSHLRLSMHGIGMVWKQEPVLDFRRYSKVRVIEKILP